MTVETAADRATMLADFGELFIFSPGAVWPNRSSGDVEIMAIFDAEYLAIATEQGQVVAGNPVTLCRSADVAGAVRNSVMIRAATDKLYKVVNVQDDGTGITVLELEGPR